MPELDGSRRRGWRAGTLVSGAATAVVIAALVLAATDGVPTAAARLGATTTLAGSKPAAATSTSHSAVATNTTGAARGHGPTSSSSGRAVRAAHAAATTSPKSNSNGAGAKSTADTGNGTSTTTGKTPPSNSNSNSGGVAPPSSQTTNANLPCQGTTPLGVGGSWTCTFDDEFTGTSLDTSKWVPQVTSDSGYLNGATACYEDNPDTVSVSGGVLNLSVRQVAPFTCSYPGGSFATSYEAGMVSTYGLFDQTYGAFEVSAKLPPASISGLQETMWLYPQSLNVGAGSSPAEIDFAEFFSQYPGLDVPYVHYGSSASDPDVTAYDCALNQGTFNTYEVDWAPGTITVLYNGTTCLVDHPSTGAAPFDQPFFIALTQALGVGTNAFSASSTPLPATTQVDWVRGWSPSS